MKDFFFRQNNLKQYIRLEYKKTGRSLTRMLAALMLLILIILGGTAGAGYLLYRSGLFSPVEIAVVIPGDQAEVRRMSGLLSMAESVNRVCRFAYVNEQTAREGIGSGRFRAAIILPVNFYEDVNEGRNTPATVVMPEHPALNTAVFKELVSDGTRLIGITEAAVYAATDTAADFQAPASQADIENILTDIYMKNILSRERTFREEVLSPTGRTDIREYYTSAFLAEILLLCGIFFGFLYKPQDRAVERKLRMYGVGAAAVSAVKVAVMMTVLFGMAVFLYAAACVVSDTAFRLQLAFDPAACISFLPAAFSMAAFFHMIYSLGSNQLQISLLLLILSFIMILLCGCVLPTAYLPAAVRAAGRAMPLFWWRQYLSDALYSLPAWQAGLSQILTGMLFAGIGGGLLCRNI